jgi:alkyl hydroperoxide reductase subunit AhpC
MTNEASPNRLIGNTAPDFKANALVNGEIKEGVSLSDFNGKWKVLYFYPLDFTFVCPTEITAFDDNLDKFKEVNCEVIGCSVDSEFSHLAWSQKSRDDGGIGQIRYPILADITKQIARSYGVLLDESVALRGTFILDDKNVVQHCSINNLSVGRNVEEVLRLVQGYQHTAKVGEVCPANWNKGGDTMKPDPKGSKEYFSKLK